MRIPNLSLGPEWALLELCTLGVTTPAQKNLFESIVNDSERIHWGELLEQALIHKMVPSVACQIFALPGSLATPGAVERFLHSELKRNKHYMTVVRKEAARIVAALNKEKIQYVGTKGIVFESTIYCSAGTRVLSDIDFTVHPSEASRLCSIMDGLGYELGCRNWREDKIVPEDRKRMLTYKLSPDHHPRFAGMTGDPIFPILEVDFATSLTWERSPFVVPIDIAFESISSQLIPGQSELLPRFSPTLQFIHTVLHLFREGWLINNLANPPKTTKLQHFMDVIRLWDTYYEDLCCPAFVEFLKKYKIIDPVVWVLAHIDRSLETEFINSLMLSEYTSDTWLSSSQLSGGHSLTWNGNMRRRLHSKRSILYSMKD